MVEADKKDFEGVFYNLARHVRKSDKLIFKVVTVTYNKNIIHYNSVELLIKFKKSIKST